MEQNNFCSSKTQLPLADSWMPLAWLALALSSILQARAEMSSALRSLISRFSFLMVRRTVHLGMAARSISYKRNASSDKQMT